MKFSPITSLSFSPEFIYKTHGGVLEKTLSLLDRILQVSSKCIQLLDVTEEGVLIFKETSFSISNLEMVTRVIAGILLLPLTILALALSILLKGVFYYKYASREWKQISEVQQPKKLEPEKLSKIEKKNTDPAISQEVPESTSKPVINPKLKSTLIKEEEALAKKVFNLVKDGHFVFVDALQNLEKKYSTKIFPPSKTTSPCLIICNDTNLFLQNLEKQLSRSSVNDDSSKPFQKEVIEFSQEDKDLLINTHSAFFETLSLVENFLKIQLKLTSFEVYQDFDIFFEKLMAKAKKAPKHG
ncbi:hypothetical protein [Chlamydiifrater volucris]|uniref:hypothetical protein n=1 Tax=Chlamydiifrater volucris TaxID=2681470 RepID=UPI001BD0769D|nr:hypothetical protein [Chlamydiifrater volucris]